MNNRYPTVWKCLDCAAPHITIEAIDLAKFDLPLTALDQCLHTATDIAVGQHASTSREFLMAKHGKDL